MSRVLLELIVTDVADAEAAVAGGADRVELVGRADLGGMTPDPATAAAVVATVACPVRVMVRRSESHQLDADDVRRLVDDVEALRSAGVGELVLGAARPDRDPDVEVLAPVIGALAGARWTFHRAIDDAPDLADAAHRVLALPGCDTVLTSGRSAGVDSGLPRLVRLLESAPDLRPHVMVGGGLRTEHLSRLLDAGVRAVHLGRSVREGGSWSGAVDRALVAEVRRRLTEHDDLG